jgi:glycosyltransferase involved in cell wall biosynthesis
LNILFVLYHDFTANSAGHVRPLANELTKFGNECCVAVPNNSPSVSNLGPAKFRAVDFQEGLQTGFGFSDGRGPDIIHAWTPREIVRKFCESVRKAYGCRLFIHLEDNEWHLLSCAFEMPFESIRLLDEEELERRVPDTLSHPRRAVEFLSAADGITVIIDRLSELLPPVKAILELWPSADEGLFMPRAKNQSYRNRMGIAKNSTTLAYTGNVHRVNAHDVRSLYLAVAILNREGHPATLVRAGREFYPFLGPEEEWGRRHTIELGMVPHVDVSRILSLADILVQPGKADEFNDYRFPSKLPEFLSAGRPVILPRTNIARHMIHGRHAYILSESNAVAIANAIREVMQDQELYDRLSEGALEFFKERLSWTESAKKLNNFYLEPESKKRVS